VIPLDDAAIAAALANLPGWRSDGEALAIAWRFASFEDAMAWMADCLPDITAMQHHPDWRNVYDRVWVRLTTHDAGNRITIRDVELAKRLAWRAAAFGAQ
jgi:4a-hydroxytetrahydrobiopterin dehydratase